VQASAHADYLRVLGVVVSDDETTEESKEDARLRLLAHVYALHVTHLTTGMRIGALIAICTLISVNACHRGRTACMVHQCAMLCQPGFAAALGDAGKIFRTCDGPAAARVRSITEWQPVLRHGCNLNASALHQSMVVKVDWPLLPAG